MREERRETLKLTLAMFIYGTIGIFRRYIPYPSSVIAMARGVIGALFLMVLLAVKKEKIDWMPIRKHWKPLLLSGVLLGLNWVLLFEAYRYTSVSVATVCYYMAPIFVILVSPFLLGEHLSGTKRLCVAAAFLGIILVSGIFGTGVSGLRGILLGLGAAVLYAVVVLLNKALGELRVYDRTILQLAAAAVALVPYILLTEDLSSLQMSGTILWMLLFVGIVHTGIAYALYFGSLRVLPAQKVALFSYIDPVTSILLSALILKEHLDALTILGIVLVLGATVCSEFLPEKRGEPT